VENFENCTLVSCKHMEQRLRSHIVLLLNNGKLEPLWSKLNRLSGQSEFWSIFLHSLHWVRVERSIDMQTCFDIVSTSSCNAFHPYFSGDVFPAVHNGTLVSLSSLELNQGFDYIF